MKFNLDTIVLFVQNVDKLKSFYTEVFQLTVVEEFKSEWVLLQAGNAKIGLHKIGEQYRDDSAEEFKFDNNTKIVFEIKEDINQVKQELLKKNVVMREIKTFDNYDFIMCDGEDPEGNVFQLKQKK